MQLPVDIKALVNEATSIDDATKTPLSVGVLLDPTAPPDLIACVRTVFASELPTVRLTVNYLDTGNFVPYPADDMVVIAAGLSQNVGSVAASIRAAGVPVMVATTLPRLVDDIANASGYPIPDGDIASPVGNRSLSNLGVAGVLAQVSSGISGTASTVVHALSTVLPAAEVPAETLAGFSRAQDRMAQHVAEDADRREWGVEEPFLLDETLRGALLMRMGQWIVTACYDKRLAFSIAFPFVRRPLAQEAVDATSAQNAGIGLFPLIPGADLPIMTLNQGKMILQIAAAYGQPMEKERAKEIIPAIGGAFACRAAARALIEAVPGLGFVWRTAIGYAGTAVIGRAIIEYFEGGENIGGLAAVLSTAWDKGTELFDSAQTAMMKSASSEK